jgi:hypothetical protein
LLFQKGAISAQLKRKIVDRRAKRGSKGHSGQSLFTFLEDSSDRWDIAAFFVGPLAKESGNGLWIDFGNILDSLAHEVFPLTRLR